MATSKPQTVRALSISFDLPIYPRQIPSWRGAFIEMAGWEHDCFHNHYEDGRVRYRYPLAQYRVWQKKAALFVLNEGVEALQRVLAEKDWKINWEGGVRSLRVEDLRMWEHEIRLTPEVRRYQTYQYLPLNQANYKTWMETDRLAERLALLERLLTNHLLVGLWNLGFESQKQVRVSLQDFRRRRLVSFKGTKRLAFDLVFDCNVSLPPHIAIGQAASHGFGQLAPVNQVKRKRPESETLVQTLSDRE